MLMLDLAGRPVDGARAEKMLERAGITVNRIRIPGAYDDAPFGLRLGTPAMTTRGMGPPQAALIAELIAELIDHPDSEAIAARVSEAVGALAREFPVYT
jgi:glycine hydroxymethyltransferase